MRRLQLTILLLIALLPWSGCTVYGERPVRAFADATGGEGLERAFWRDIQTQNWKDLDHHVSSNIVYVTPSGRFERAAAMEHIQQLHVQEFSIGDLEPEMNCDLFLLPYPIVPNCNSHGIPLL